MKEEDHHMSNQKDLGKNEKRKERKEKEKKIVENWK